MDAESAEFKGLKSVGIPREQLRQWLAKKPSLALAHIALEWLLIIAPAWVTWHHFNALSYIATVIWIGARQHALGILMHDAAHGNLFTTRRTNYVVSDLLLAWPLLVSTKVYWQGHVVHHRHTKTEKDTDWTVQRTVADYQCPKSWGQYARYLCRDLTGLGVFQLIRMFLYISRRPKEPSLVTPDTTPQVARLLRLLYYALIIATVTYYSAWSVVLLFWFVPFITWLKWILYLRSFAEHHGFAGTGPLGHTRTTLVSLWDRLLIGPKNINYHMEHHIYPSMPFYHLPQLHRFLMTRPEYKSQVHVTKGYLNVMAEAVAFHPQDA